MGMEVTKHFYALQKQTQMTFKSHLSGLVSLFLGQEQRRPGVSRAAMRLTVLCLLLSFRAARLWRRRTAPKSGKLTGICRSLVKDVTAHLHNSCVSQAGEHV